MYTILPTFKHAKTILIVAEQQPRKDKYKIANRARVYSGEDSRFVATTRKCGAKKEQLCTSRGSTPSVATAPRSANSRTTGSGT